MTEQVAPNDEAIITEFISVEDAGSSTYVRVEVIHWEGAHTPTSEWVLAEEIPGSASPEVIRAVVRRILNTRRFFSVCQECGERNPRGWMHDASICQECAARNHGVVY
jgi:ribosomal protein L40E